MGVKHGVSSHTSFPLHMFIQVRGWRIAACLLSGILQDARVLPESDRGGFSEPRGLLRRCMSVLLSNSALAREVNARIHGLCGEASTHSLTGSSAGQL